MTENKIRIMLVDDHRLVLESWKILIDNDPRFSIVADCEDGDEAIHKAGLYHPEIILMDINMTPMSGFEATEKILEAYPFIKIIGISINNQPVYANHIMKLGAKGFVTKGCTFEELAHAILQVHRGDEYICNEVKKNMN